MRIKSVSAKDPDSVEWFSWDFANMLKSGDTIDDLDSIEITGGDELEVVDDTEDHDDTTVTAKLSGGALGTTYTCRARVTTTPSEETLDLSFTVTIAEH